MSYDIALASDLANILFIIVISANVYSISKRVKKLEDRGNRRAKKNGKSKR